MIMEIGENGLRLRKRMGVQIPQKQYHLQELVRKRIKNNIWI
jgi:hypothetical protein